MVMSILAVLVFLSTAFQKRSVPVSIIVSSSTITKYRNSIGRMDLASMNFSIYVDLGPVFNWNVKHLYLYLSAEYTTEINALNQVILWDKIISRGENPRFDFHNITNKYVFLDDGYGLRGNKNVSLFLSWHIIPNAGILFLIPASSKTVISLPEKYEETKNY
ncbi:signal peptidase complex subunit 3-like [Mobula hypostoma]|uniref:signal peptidase complex subunit 3-like n=1 Tax=Mobula hypostoma TaxID=723540 RepID=UPI002FC333E9